MSYSQVYKRKPKLTGIELNAMQLGEKFRNQDFSILNTIERKISERLQFVYSRRRSNSNASLDNCSLRVRFSVEESGGCMDSVATNSDKIEDVNNSNYGFPSAYRNDELGNEEKELPGTSLPFHINGVEIPISSNSIQKTNKRKRQNNEMRSRKKIYRPKVIGEGKPRKTEGPTTPKLVENKLIYSSPKTPSPVTPNRPSSKSRTKNLVASKKGGYVSKKRQVSVIEGDKAVSASEVIKCSRKSCRRVLKFDEVSGKSFKGTVIQNPIETLENGFPNCKSDIYNQRVIIEAEKATADVNVPDNQWSSFQVYQRKTKSSELLHFLELEIPKQLKKKRTSSRLNINTVWMKGLNCNSGQTKWKNSMKLSNKISKKNQNGLGNRLWLTSCKGRSLFTRRIGSRMLRRSNFAALPFCNPLVKNKPKNAIENEKVENSYGNTERVRWNHMTSLGSSKPEYSSRDSNGNMWRQQCSALEARSTQDVATLERRLDTFQEKLLVPYAADGCYQEAQFMLLPANTGTSWSSSLSNDDSQKERFVSFKDKLIIPYISDEGKFQPENNASSVCTEIVPHRKLSNSNKKQRELDRIYLDPRNITMWKLLIKNEGNFGREKVDINTAEWWENERNLFRGRIDAFVSRLHLILGDRRFSPWKGSVVDSVVGVFLTQNVADHHSSSAFMSLAATFPLPSTTNHSKNYDDPEIVCIQESSERSKGSFECESNLNNQSKKATKDIEAAQELRSANDATSHHYFQVSSAKKSAHGTQLLSLLYMEEECGMCESSNSETTDILHSNEAFFVEGSNSSQNKALSLERYPESRILESKEMDDRNENSTSENLKHGDIAPILESSGQCYQCEKCSSQSNTGHVKKPEIYNLCQGTSGVALQLTTVDESQRILYGVGKGQTQDIRPTNNCSDKSCLPTECHNHAKRGAKKTTGIYNYIREEAEVSPQLSSIDVSSEKLVADVEVVQSQVSKIQAPDGGNNIKRKGKKVEGKHMEGKSSYDLDNNKKEIPTSVKTMKNKQEIDWDSLQNKWDTLRRVYSSCESRSSDHMDSVNWEAVRCAEPSKIADAIKERGQHNVMASRIKAFLDGVSKIHGSIDLEWLRNAPADDVKEYLLRIYGLGLKSVECTRLLALQQVAFPVDINVGRIAVRLGWVPLQPLPEEVQIHLLELFPMMNSIQKYLWPRLCTLDQRTLYELHYTLITFGKVFCTKRKPNCNACPLKGECRHYASAYASARLALPGPSEKAIVNSVVPDNVFEGTANLMSLAKLQIEGRNFFKSRCQTNDEPIIEEPSSPELEYAESELTDIEDLFKYDSDDIPTMRLLTSEQFATTSKNCMDIIDKRNQDCGSSRALIVLNATAASIPIPKLKHINRLRTKHQVYELPDTHPLLSELERREPNDPCPYLLCILTPGETESPSEPPYTRCAAHQESGDPREEACPSCNSDRQQSSGLIHGTILIPCRTALRGVFPLNGTYFQVNEVFADDETSKEPIHVPSEWIWNLPRRITYFGTSTSTIFRGLAMEDIQYCFKRGFICLRGFDRNTRKPKRLVHRLHRSTAAAAAATKTNPNKAQPHEKMPTL